MPNDYDMSVVDRIGSGATKTLQIPYRYGKEIGEGRVGAVSQIFLLRKESDLDAPPEKLPTLVYKRYLDAGDRENIDRLHESKLEVYSRLRRHPTGKEYVIPTFRAAPEGWVMTDLTKNEQNLVFSKNENNEQSLRQLRKHPLAELVKRITPEYIQRQMGKIASAAADAGVRVSNDSIFFTLEASGVPRFQVVDLDNVFATNEEKYSLQEKIIKACQMFYSGLPIFKKNFDTVI